MKRKGLLFLIYILFSVLLYACWDGNECDDECESKNEELVILVVPHQLNLKAYFSETNVDLPFISSEKIKGIQYVIVNLSKDSIGGFDGVESFELVELDCYKSYYIYRLSIGLTNVQGDVSVDSVTISVNDKIYTFKTDIRIQSYTVKEVHFYTGEDGGAIALPGFAEIGFSHWLESTEDVELVGVYLEGTKNSNLSQYISNVYFNKKPFEEGIKVYKEDPFYLEIKVSNDYPRHVMVIDQFIIEYKKDDSTTDFGYVLGHIILSSLIECGKKKIDSISTF